MFRTRLLLTLASLTTIVLSSCSTVITLDYVPDRARGVMGEPVCGVAQFRDQRGMAPTMLGSVGIPGVSKIAEVPLTNVYLSVPVDEAVHNAFTHALDHRKMLSSGTRPKFQLAGEVLDLHCELFKNPYAVAQLRVNLIETATGRILHTQVSKAERQSVFYIQGTTDPMPIMREITSRALQDAVDQALDKPELREAMNR
jgi:hypothetical protein